MKRVFIVGCPRSGTTLVQALLARYPGLHSFPETRFFEALLGGIDRRWQEQTWQHHLAFGLGGMAAGALLTLCVFLH